MLCRRCLPLRLFAALWAASAVHAMRHADFPSTPGDLQRAALRRNRLALAEGRTVEPKTLKLREKLLDQFSGGSIVRASVRMICFLRVSMLLMI